MGQGLAAGADEAGPHAAHARCEQAPRWWAKEEGKLGMCYRNLKHDETVEKGQTMEKHGFDENMGRNRGHFKNTEKGEAASNHETLSKAPAELDTPNAFANGRARRFQGKSLEL